mmetsp:Transcript_24996/g.41818  ORF Transcript_24996/g.41818 Transcript_24996/m.41818 type:complete len:317 (+) Transcript_24996:522-1472(+)
MCPVLFSGVLDRSNVASENGDNARRMLLFISDGGSFEILMHVWRILSGTILANGAPAMGSALKKHLKSLCAVSAAISSLRSNDGIQPCIRWQLSRNTHPPFCVYLSSTPSAIGSWPCPMEMIVSWPFSEVLPMECASVSTSLDGEYPGKRMKKMGVDGPVSSYICAALNASWLTYAGLMSFSTKTLNPPVMRSGRTARISSSFWNSVRLLFHSPGSGTRSHSSLVAHFSQISDFFSMSLTSPPKGWCSSSAMSPAHWLSISQLDSSSVMGGGAAAFFASSNIWYSFSGIRLSLCSTVNVSKVATMSLCASNRPRRV